MLEQDYIKIRAESVQILRDDEGNRGGKYLGSIIAENGKISLNYGGKTFDPRTCVNIIKFGFDKLGKNGILFCREEEGIFFEFNGQTQNVMRLLEEYEQKYT